MFRRREVALVAVLDATPATAELDGAPQEQARASRERERR